MAAWYVFALILNHSYCITTGTIKSRRTELLVITKKIHILYICFIRFSISLRCFFLLLFVKRICCPRLTFLCSFYTATTAHVLWLRLTVLQTRKKITLCTKCWDLYIHKLTAAAVSAQPFLVIKPQSPSQDTSTSVFVLRESMLHTARLSQLRTVGISCQSVTYRSKFVGNGNV